MPAASWSAPGSAPGARWWPLLCVLTTSAALAGDGPAAVSYRGEISAENNRQLFAALADREVERLVIDSPGGDVRAGIALGRWVFRQGLDVVVARRCLSSCANYVFTAGRRKIIKSGAVVAWHGNYHHLEATGLWTDDIPSRMARTGENRATATAEVERQMQELVGEERAFFGLIGVDQRLCWFGKMPPYSVPDYYTLSAADMRRFGVHSVVTEGDYSATDLRALEVDVRWVQFPAPAR